MNMNPADNPSTAPAEAEPTRFARVRWPLIIVAMLGGHMGAMALAVSIAQGDSTAGVNGAQILPEYYERSMSEEERRAAALERAREAVPAAAAAPEAARAGAEPLPEGEAQRR